VQFFLTATLSREGLKTTPNAAFEQRKDVNNKVVKKKFRATSCKATKFLCILEHNLEKSDQFYEKNLHSHYTCFGFCIDF